MDGALLQITGLCVAVGEEVQGVEEAVGELAMLQLKQDPGSVGKEGDMGKAGDSRALSHGTHRGR